MRTALAVALTILSACGTPVVGSSGASSSPVRLAACDAYAPQPLNVGAEISHNKTSATVVEVTSPCTVRVRISGMNMGSLATFNDRVIVLRATSRTTYKTGAEGDLSAIGKFGLKAGDVFTLSFDARAFPDGSYPLNFMNW